jgi:hypothetical protein
MSRDSLTIFFSAELYGKCAFEIAELQQLFVLVNVSVDGISFRISALLQPLFQFVEHVGPCEM